MACVSQFRVDLVRVAPVNSGLGSACEEVGGVSSERDGRDRAHDFCLRFYVHVLEPNLCNSPIPGSHEDVSVLKLVNAVYALGEKFLYGADALEEGALQGDLKHVTSLRAQEGVAVGWVNGTAGEDSLDSAHIDVLELDFLVDEVCCPDSDAVVVDGEELGVGPVVELNLVGSVGADGVAAEGLASGDLFELIILILTSQMTSMLSS